MKRKKFYCLLLTCISLLGLTGCLKSLPTGLTTKNKVLWTIEGVKDTFLIYNNNSFTFNIKHSLTQAEMDLTHGKANIYGINYYVEISNLQMSTNSSQISFFIVCPTSWFDTYDTFSTDEDGINPYLGLSTNSMFAVGYDYSVDTLNGYNYRYKVDINSVDYSFFEDKKINDGHPFDAGKTYYLNGKQF
ncbi:MAG: hypothetical protein WCS51_04425 [Bacilli bacterium]|jgi:hypothetical protein